MASKVMMTNKIMKSLCI